MATPTVEEVDQALRTLDDARIRLTTAAEASRSLIDGLSAVSHPSRDHVSNRHLICETASDEKSSRTLCAFVVGERTDPPGCPRGYP